MQTLKYSLAVVATLTFNGCISVQKENNGNSSSSMGMMPMMGIMSMMNMNSKKNQHDANSTHIKGQEDSKAYIIANKYCTQCHNMKNKNLHTANEWKPILKRMIAYIHNQGKLKPDEYEKVMIEHYYGVDT